MQNNVLLTPVDEMVGLVKDNPNCTINFLSEKLRVPLEILERWLVILDEYDVLDVKYKGFEGFVSISNKHEKSKEDVDLDNLKAMFVSKCREKGLGFDQMEVAWPKFLSFFEEEIKKLFESNAKKKGYDKIKTSKGWTRYRKELERL